jgi:drug/metabolite transporter (DMT)-like permease
MVFIPPSHVLHQKSGKPASQHDTTVGMFVVFVIMLCIALFIFIAGPRSDNPPPLLVGYAVSALAFTFGLVAFFSWMKEQGDGDASSDDGNTPDRES